MSASPSQTRTGYAHLAYAAALPHMGSVRELPECGGTLLERAIGASGKRDATGPYPLFTCARWDAIARDLDTLADELVSVTLVTDPFGDWTPELLQSAFPDVARPFKEHLVTDLTQPISETASRHHRRDTRSGARNVDVVVCDDDPRWTAEWCQLYANLAQRHGIVGPAAFSASSLAAQLDVPGARLVRAEKDGEVVAMSAWYVNGDVAVYHLSASSEEGYALGAAYPLMYTALELLRAEGCRWAHLGAGAGSRPDTDDGLTRFKRGWATGTRSAWLCGRILDHDAYAALAPDDTPGDVSGWFPAYRKGGPA